MERLSFPVGILIPRSHANWLQASTALYRRASSPSFLHGHIQLALKETLFRPSVSGAHMIFVKASATESIDPAAGSIIAACGACPIDVAIPALPR